MSPDAPAADHLHDILTRSTRVAEAIKALRSEHAVDRVSIWVHLDSPASGLSLDPDLLRRVAEFGSLEIDIYS